MCGIFYLTETLLLGTIQRSFQELFFAELTVLFYLEHLNFGKSFIGIMWVLKMKSELIFLHQVLEFC